eukprot:scaffold2275_cov245-Pinguiococcus_pyrenoidosus.AAC.7
MMHSSHGTHELLRGSFRAGKADKPSSDAEEALQLALKGASLVVDHDVVRVAKPGLLRAGVLRDGRFRRFAARRIVQVVVRRSAVRGGDHVEDRMVAMLPNGALAELARHQELVPALLVHVGLAVHGTAVADEHGLLLPRPCNALEGVFKIHLRLHERPLEPEAADGSRKKDGEEAPSRHKQQPGQRLLELQRACTAAACLPEGLALKVLEADAVGEEERRSFGNHVHQEASIAKEGRKPHQRGGLPGAWPAREHEFKDRRHACVEHCRESLALGHFSTDSTRSTNCKEPGASVPSSLFKGSGRPASPFRVSLRRSA